MAIQSGASFDISIGTTAAATDLAGFEADTYTVIGEVSEIGEHGDERSSVQFVSLADARVRKLRGPADAGDMPITYAFDGANGGQDAVKTAFEVASQSADEYNFRIRYSDSGGTNPTTEYFRGKVMSHRTQGVSADQVVTRQAMIGINSAIIEKDSA